jgi:hypothetical protein
MRCETNCRTPSQAKDVSAYKILQVHFQRHSLKAIGLLISSIARLTIGFSTTKQPSKAIDEHNDFNRCCYARSVA